jgi:hypothetical protein
MFKVLKNVINGIKQVKKYGSLAFAILDSLGYTADKLESWRKENDPDEKVEGELKQE